MFRPSNKAAFEAAFLQVLLLAGESGLGTHKSAAVRQAVRAAGQAVLLAPYSPNLNPTEQVFAKLKTLLRKAAQRTVEATWKRIGTPLDVFSPKECANYLAIPAMPPFQLKTKMH